MLVEPSGNYAKNSVGKAAQKFLDPIYKFMAVEASSGILLLCTTVFSLILANLETAHWYFDFINTPISVSVGSFVIEKNFLLLVNDGLMAIFFYLVGLEIKREILVGELSTPKKASFSIFAAIGGMIFPALIFTYFNSGTDYARGWGIPMATDIAFAVGVLTILGKRVPTALKIFLLALAIVDDLGAVLIIALFYTNEIATNYLGIAGLALFFLFLLNYSGVRNIAWGLALGVVSWFCFLKSGVHATIAGVILAFLTPSRPVGSIDSVGPVDKKEEKALLIDCYIHALHPWVAFVIMPIFAFFNAGVSFEGISFEQIFSNSVVIGISLGLVLGNPIGIFCMTLLATKLKIAEFPNGISWFQVIGVGFLAGIGFTMSLFINNLAFKGKAIESYSKIGILMGSAVTMVVGVLILLSSFTKSKKTEAAAHI